jgi:TonB family protein
VLIYPKSAQQNNYYGNTTIEVFISKTGSVMDARVIRSSGYAVLDNAAKEYCEKVIFNPAMAGGSPINSRSVLKVKFDLSNQDTFEKAYVSGIKKLFNKIEEVAENEKYNVQNEILTKHKEFLANMQDETNCNSIMIKILSPEITEQWKAYMEYCALTFLIYHDFLTKFPDYKNIYDVKSELKNEVAQVLLKLSRMPGEKFDSHFEKDKILLLIKNFIQKNYPDLNINDAGDQALNS